MLLSYGDNHALAGAELDQCHEISTQIAHEIESNGQDPAAPVPGVRMRGAKPFVTDGPFAETREQLGG